MNKNLLSPLKSLNLCLLTFLYHDKEVIDLRQRPFTQDNDNNVIIRGIKSRMIIIFFASKKCLPTRINMLIDLCDLGIPCFTKSERQLESILLPYPHK